MTVTADTKKRVVIPGAAPGDVFICEQNEQGVVLRRIFRETPRKKLSKAQVRKAIENWKSVPKISWEELRKMTREI